MAAGNDVVRSAGNEVVRSDDGDEIVRSASNDVVRSEGNEVVLSDDGGEIVRSAGIEVVRSAGNEAVVSDGGGVVLSNDDKQAAQALVHLSSLPLEVYMSSFCKHEAFRIMGPLLIPSYSGAHTSDVREAAFALDAIRRGATMKDDLDILANDNVEDATRVLRILGFHV